MKKGLRSIPREIGEVHPISDKSKLFWERFFLPMQSAAISLNSAIINTQNIIGAIIIEMEGFSPETHIFDPEKMRVVQRPKPKGE